MSPCGTERTNGLTVDVFRYPALSRHNDVDVRLLQVFVCSGKVNGLVGQQAERTVVDRRQTLIGSSVSVRVYQKSGMVASSFLPR